MATTTLSFSNILLCAAGTVRPRGSPLSAATAAPPIPTDLTESPVPTPLCPAHHHHHRAQNEGKLEASPELISWRSRAEDKVVKVALAGAKAVSFYDMGRACQLWVSDANSELHRFDGFRASEYDKLAAFFSAAGHTLARKELSTKGRNWGSLRLAGAQLEFLDDAGKLVAPIPLSAISQAAQPGRGEVDVQFFDDDNGEPLRPSLRHHPPPARQRPPPPAPHAPLHSLIPPPARRSQWTARTRR
jgi:hypothetical protein